VSGETLSDSVCPSLQMLIRAIQDALGISLVVHISCLRLQNARYRSIAG